MKWYDYVVCVLIADYVTAMLFAGSIFVFIPLLIFELYKDMRKFQNEKEKDE
jgi:hypothetical protein